MTFQCLLALVSGTCVPHLQRSGQTRPIRCRKDRTAAIRREDQPWRANLRLACSAQLSPPCCGACGTDPTHLDGLVRRATEEQVTHGIDTETPDRALVSHEGPFALEDLLRIIGCRWES